MDNELKQRWVAALRSGDYPQTRGTLRRNSGYCCLGVLAEVAGMTIIDDGCEGAIEGTPAGKGYDPIYELISSPTAQILVKKNDSGVSFSEIADWIEAKL